MWADCAHAWWRAVQHRWEHFALGRRCVRCGVTQAADEFDDDVLCRTGEERGRPHADGEPASVEASDDGQAGSAGPDLVREARRVTDQSKFVIRRAQRRVDAAHRAMARAFELIARAERQRARSDSRREIEGIAASARARAAL
jgi:hypothetical protein